MWLGLVPRGMAGWATVGLGVVRFGRDLFCNYTLQGKVGFGKVGFGKVRFGGVWQGRARLGEAGITNE